MTRPVSDAAWRKQRRLEKSLSLDPAYLCPDCEGDGCDRCGESGFRDSETFFRIIEESPRDVAAWPEWMQTAFGVLS